jgi:hypothetical protein
MSNSDWITVWGIAITFFVTVVGSVWLVAFQIGSMRARIVSIEKIVEDVPKMKYSLGQVLVKVDVLWHNHLIKSNSPMVLNDEGLRLLHESGIGTFAEIHYAEIISEVKKISPQNAYQAQEALSVVLNKYQTIDTNKLMFEEAAFLSGSDVDSLLFVAALSIRDRLISDLGFTIESR